MALRVNGVRSGPERAKRGFRRDRRVITLSILIIWAVGASAGLGWMIYEQGVQVSNTNALLLYRIGAVFDGANATIQWMISTGDVGVGEATVADVGSAQEAVNEAHASTGSSTLMDSLNLTDRILGWVQDEFEYVLVGLNATTLNSTGAARFFQDSGVLFGQAGRVLLRVSPDGRNPLDEMGPGSVASVAGALGQLYDLSRNYVGPVEACR